MFGVLAIQAIESQCERGAVIGALKMCQYMRRKLNNVSKEGFHLDKICLLGTILSLHLNDQ